MEDPDYIIIKGLCPKCVYLIVVYLEWPLVLWIVFFDNSECDYVYPEHFAILEDLAKKFEAKTDELKNRFLRGGCIKITFTFCNSQQLPMKYKNPSLAISVYS